MYRFLRFTLIELLVVVAVIAILLSLLLPGLQAAKGKAKQIQCAGQLKQQYLAFGMYSIDWGCYPALDAGNGLSPNPFPWPCYWTFPLGPYTGDPKLAKWGYGYWHGFVSAGSPKTLYVCPSVYPYQSNMGMSGNFHDGWWGYGMSRAVPPANEVSSWAGRYRVFPRPEKIDKAAMRVLVADGRNVQLGSNWELTQSAPTCYACDTVRHNRGANLLYCDGHVTWTAEGEIRLRSITAATKDEFFY